MVQLKVSRTGLANLAMNYGQSRCNGITKIRLATIVQYCTTRSIQLSMKDNQLSVSDYLSVIEIVF